MAPSHPGGMIKTGVIRFVGKTEFAPGIWIGLELDAPEGLRVKMQPHLNFQTCPKRIRYSMDDEPATSLGQMLINRKC